MADELFTRQELAQRYKVTPDAVSKWAREGRVRVVVTPGGRRRYQLPEGAQWQEG